MKAKRFLKSLLSLALAVIITASVCVCGFSVAAADENSTTTTVNFFDGTTAATYTGNSTDGMLSASAGITGILEGQSVARLVPQYAYDGVRKISLGTRTLEAGEIDYTAAKTLYLYVKNDLGEGIQWRIGESADANATLGISYHANFFSTGTQYWLVNGADNTAKKYSYTKGEYIYIPKDFDGYIVFDLNTCDSEALTAFFACNLDHIIFWMMGFTEETVGNPFYYGDMNLTTLSFDEIVNGKLPNSEKAIYEYVGLNPLTDTWASGAGDPDYAYACTSTYVNNEYIGQSLAFTTFSTNGPVIKSELFAIDGSSTDYSAIVFKLKLPAGATGPAFRIAQSKTKAGGWNSGTIKGDWTTVNLINNEVNEYSKVTPESITIGEEGFEGYFIFHLNSNLTVTVPTADITGTEYTTKLSWTQFFDLYKGYVANVRLALSAYKTEDTEALTINLGEISVVNDIDSFLFNLSANEHIVSDPANGESFNFLNLTSTGVQTTETIGDTIGFTYNGSGYGRVDFTDISVNENFKDYEALVFKVRMTNQLPPAIVFGHANHTFKTKFYTVNTLTGAITKNAEVIQSSTLTIPDEIFEGYIIAVIDNETTLKVSSAGTAPFISWSDAVDHWLGTDAKTFDIWIRHGAAYSNRFNGWQLGEVSFVKDLDEFLAPYETEVDPNQNVVFDPLFDTPVLSSVTTETVKTNNIGWALQYSTETAETTKAATAFKTLAIDASFGGYEAIVFKAKTTNGVAMPGYQLGTYGYINTKYITVNTLNGEISYSAEAATSAPAVAGGEFEGYIIAPTAEMTVRDTTYKAWATWVTDKTGSNVALRIGLDNTAQDFNSWQLGEISFVTDLDSYIEKVTKPAVEGDANLDGEADVRDLVAMKKAIAGIKDIKINAFNVKFDNIGSAVAGSDLTVIRKKFLDIENWKPTFDEIGMAIYGLTDVANWDKTYGEEYGYAKDIFNYATAQTIEGAKSNAANGAVSWLKINNNKLFTDAENPTVMSATYLTSLENKINGYKNAGTWDSFVGFFTEEIRLSITDEQYKVLTKYLRDTYPGKRIMAVLSVEEVMGREATEEKAAITPANYDTYQYTTDICYDYYYSTERTTYDNLNATLASNLQGLDYKKWYMPKAFYKAVDSNVAYSEPDFLLDHLNLMYELLMTEENKGGLWLYGWNSYANDDLSEGQIGLCDITNKGDYSEFIKRIAEIGAEIQKMN